MRVPGSCRRISRAACDAAAARHLDVEQDDVGRVLAGQRDRLGRVLGLPDQLERRDRR